MSKKINTIQTTNIMKKVLKNLDWRHILIISMILASIIPSKADNLEFGFEQFYKTFMYCSIYSLILFVVIYPIFIKLKK